MRGEKCRNTTTNPLEICHLLNTTADYYGMLEDFVPKYNRRDIADYIKLCTGNNTPTLM